MLAALILIMNFVVLPIAHLIAVNYGAIGGVLTLFLLFALGEFIDQRAVRRSKQEERRD
jgi:uncharacterized membrane protein